jgi:hypothetical protein
MPSSPHDMTYLHETENKSCLYFSFHYCDYDTDFIAEESGFDSR